MFKTNNLDKAKSDFERDRFCVIDNILEAIIEKIPAPKGQDNAPLEAMIFDSVFNSFGLMYIVFCLSNTFCGNKLPYNYGDLVWGKMTGMSDKKSHSSL